RLELANAGFLSLGAALVRFPPESRSSHPATRGGGRSRSGQPRFGWESLSQTELVVADLAARGRTNREIADALLLSPHTVDSHIRHIYRKLGIASRVVLTRVVLAHGDSVPGKRAVDAPSGKNGGRRTTRADG